MKVLIAYDTVSPSQLTKAVAMAIGDAFREKGIDADVLYFNDVEKTKLAEYECFIVGAPTMAFRPSKGISQFLDSMRGEALSGKRGAAFDTQVQTRISGNAAKGIEKRLREMGLEIFSPPLVVYVQGKGKNAWEFKAGELEKAKAWAAEAANALLKQG
ncbi:MAG: flavodoxin domain-containing protein [Candidatus Methanomethylicia archaeon]|nr:flavodoxin domain-containing protein [Candidatus Methanomethylicia archaeon]